MTMRNWVLLLALASCAGPANAPPTASQPPITPAPVVETPRPAPPPQSTDHPVRPDGDSCLGSAECASGVCEGMGCDDQHPGTCARAQRICTRDARPYCGCDGKQFTASGTCPRQRFASRGACP
ncbi:MAG TPA: hypothetical protein VF403_27975 [Kofleriaceae bacterium]